MTAQEKYADKISKLLRKAESTTPEEAELLVAKAQELMTQYAIEEYMLDAARDVERDEIVQEEFRYTGVFRRSCGEVCWAVLRRNGCLGVYSEWKMRDPADGRDKETYRITVTGFKSDIDRVRLLDASLQLQAVTAMTSWWKQHGADWMTSSQKWRERRDFLSGYANAVSAKLHVANEAAQRTAAEAEASRTGATASAASDSVALVLRSRRDRVQDWYDEKYGQTLRRGRTSYRSVSGGAWSAGSSAGSRADVGQPGVAGRRGLPS